MRTNCNKKHQCTNWENEKLGNIEVCDYHIQCTVHGAGCNTCDKVGYGSDNTCYNKKAWPENQKGETKMRKARDMFNQEIQIGNIISYPVRKGSAMYMRTARVDGLFEEDGVTKLKVTVAIPPRAEERKSNRNWKNNIKLQKATINVSWRSVIVPVDVIENDSRYSLLLN